MVVFRIEEVPYIDQNGMYVIEDILRNIKLIPELVEEESLFKDFADLKHFLQCQYSIKS